MMATRYRIAYVVIGLTFLLVVAAGISHLNSHGIERLDRIDASAQRSACSDRLTADILAAAGRALAAPPAPNAARDAAVRDIIVTARRLTHSSAICEKGTPAPYAPSS